MGRKVNSRRSGAPKLSENAKLSQFEAPDKRGVRFQLTIGSQLQHDSAPRGGLVSEAAGVTAELVRPIEPE